jgi:ribulose 1,5-bisphosphate carboxylase large subunit-like protein
MGTRRMAGVPFGPLIGTIVKPSVRLNPAETAAEVRKLVAGGIDFGKDDALQADSSTDLIFAAGGAVFGHPDGMVAGVTALRAAWDGAAAGVPMGEAARDRPALKAPLGFQ